MAHIRYQRKGFHAKKGGVMSHFAESGPAKTREHHTPDPPGTLGIYVLWGGGKTDFLKNPSGGALSII